MLFDKVEVSAGEGHAPVVLKNRIMRSATFEGIAAPDGAMTPQLQREMERLAEHNVGLVVFSYFFTEECGRAAKYQLSMASDAAAESCREAVRLVHEHGGRCAAQVCHAGVAGIVEPMGPSATEKGAREMTLEDIKRTVAAFGECARRAKAVGFDIAMLHAAHGYLMSQFLDGAANKRTDEYGGSLENRARIVREAARAMRAAVGPDYPLAVKMNVQDEHEHGMTIEESTQVAQWLAEDGITLFEASCYQAIKPASAGPCYNRAGALEWRKALKARFPNTLVALVGGIRAQKDAEKCLEDGVCDLISLSRPFIREPDLVDIWAACPTHDAVAKCVSCSACLRNAFHGKFACVFNEKKKKQEEETKAH